METCGHAVIAVDDAISVVGVNDTTGNKWSVGGVSVVVGGVSVVVDGVSVMVGDTIVSFGVEVIGVSFTQLSFKTINSSLLLNNSFWC